MGFFNRFLFSILIAFLLFVCGCDVQPKSMSQNQPPSEEEDPAELVMEKMRIQTYGPNGLQWDLEATHGRAYTTNSLMVVKNMAVDMFENRQKSSTILADEGYMDSGGNKDGLENPLSKKLTGVGIAPNDIYARGNVVVVSTDGTKLMTDWLYYHHQTELVTSSAPVQVVRQDSLTTGIGLEAMSDLSSLKIFDETVTIKEDIPPSGG